MANLSSFGAREWRQLTDLGNGERLVDDHGAEIRYVPQWKAWIIWDGTRWKRDETLEIERRAKQSVRNIVGEVAAITAAQVALPDDERLPPAKLQSWLDAILTHARKSEAANKVRAMVSCAASEERVAITPSVLDADPWLFNVRNGVVDLRTGKLRPHNPQLCLTKRSNVTFDAAAECPQWLAFLKRIFDSEQPLIDYVQRAVGYTLTGITSEQVLHLCHGTGSNGKSTFLGLLGELLGGDREYALTADFTAFLEARNAGPREDLARLAGARLVTSMEVGEGKRLNEPLIKSLTGQDIIAARFLYSGTFEFRPTFKLWLGVNHEPMIRGTDHALWRRIRKVPFLVTIPLDDRDPNLPDKLRTELPGILNWALKGCLDWQSSGLKSPAIVQLVTDQFRAASDLLGAFLEECCEFNPEYFEASRDLYSAYKRWCEENGEHQITMTMFGRKLDERGHVMSRVAIGKRRHGLKLRPSEVASNGQKSWF